MAQINPSTPQMYDLQPVEGVPNAWDLTVWSVRPGNPDACIGGCPRTTFTVTRGYPEETVIIRKLMIIRPIGADETVIVRLGNRLAGTSQDRLESVQEVIAQAQGEEGREGYVKVQDIFVAGDIGMITNVNFLDVETLNGDIGAADKPILCVMHPNAPMAPSKFDEPRYSTIRLFSDGGSLLGDVTMASSGPTFVPGIIEKLDFQGGTIGASPQSPVTIRAGGANTGLPSGAITGIIADEMHANIRGIGTGADSYLHLLGFVQVGETTTPPGSGEFTGEIRAERLCYSNVYPQEMWGLMFFTGDMRAHIWAQEAPHSGYYINMVRGRVFGTLSFGVLNQSQGAGAWVSLIGLMLQNQVFSTPNPSDPWVLSSNDAAGYTPARPASDLGGGAVGLVRFRLHANDCFPADGVSIDPASVGNEIRMRHYGPVAWDPNDGQPFKVERRRIGSISESDWKHQDCFTCTPDSNPTIVKVSTSAVSRLQRGFEYRVSRNTRPGDGSNVLRCDLPHLSISSDPEVYDYAPLVFKVCDTFYAWAPGDADDSGIVDDEDIDSVLANWGSTACMKYGDANRDNVVNVLDLETAELFYTWEYCYVGGQGMLVPQGDGFAALGFAEDQGAAAAPMPLTEAVQALGFTSTQTFGAAYDALPTAGREALAEAVMRLVRGQ